MQKFMMECIVVCIYIQVECIFRGMWCMFELFKVVEKGYCILCIYEVWYFEKWCIGFFKDYVDQWFKIKQEFVGYLVWVDILDK